VSKPQQPFEPVDVEGQDPYADHLGPRPPAWLVQPMLQSAPRRHCPPGRRKLPIVLGTAGAFLALCVGGTAWAAVAGTDSNADVAAKPAVTAPSAPAKKPTAASTRTSTSATKPTPAPTHTAKPRRSPTHVTQPSTPAPARSRATTAPRYIADPGQVAAAEAEVAQAQEQFRQAQASSYATDFDRAVAEFQLEMAFEDLDEAKTGHLSARYRNLVIRAAKLCVQGAESEYRRAMVDPTSSAADQAAAASNLAQWRGTLRQLQG
jgi:hypothetical protein